MRRITLFLAGLTVALGAMAPNRSDAVEILAGGNSCYSRSPGEEYEHDHGAIQSDNGSLALTCPFTDYDDLNSATHADIRHGQVTYLALAMYDNSASTSTTASACVRSFSGVNILCGDPDYTGNLPTGHLTLEPELSEWTNVSHASWMAYVNVDLGATGDHVNSVFVAAPDS